MDPLQLPPIPTNLKGIQHYIKTATEHEERDPVISYWCRLYALQTAMSIDKSSDDAKKLLIVLMDWLEKAKKYYSDNESITTDMAGQAYVENYALKLFNWADKMDRNSVFNKNVVKSFYTAGMLMDVLTTFGELSEEIALNRKYAKWKAAYIHNCLRTGETPLPGPISEFDNENNELENTTTETPSSSVPLYDPTVIEFDPFSSNKPVTNDKPPIFQPTPSAYTEDISSTENTGNEQKVKFTPDQINKAQKYCRFASSSLNYEDIPEAIRNLEKALQLLKTGIDE